MIPMSEKKIDEKHEQLLKEIYADYMLGITPANLSKKYHKKRKTITELVKEAKKKYGPKDVEAIVEARKKEEEEKKMPTTATEKKPPIGGKVTDDMVLEIIEAFEAGAKIKNIAEKHSLTDASVYYHLYKYYGGKEEYQKAAELRKSKKASVSIATGVAPTVKKAVPLVITPQALAAIGRSNTTSREMLDLGFGKVDLGNLYLPKANVVTCELVSERHNTGQSLSIFKSLNDYKVVDFPWQEREVNNFIDKHIHFDDKGNALDSLCVYLTGLQSVLISLINVCQRRGVALSCMHYSGGKYVKQAVAGNTSTADYGMYMQLKQACRNMYFYDCAFNSMRNNEKAKPYVICVQKVKFIAGRNGSQYQEKEFEDYIIFDSVEKLWGVYGKIVAHIQSIPDSMGDFIVFAKPLQIVPINHNWRISPGSNLARSSNF